MHLGKFHRFPLQACILVHEVYHIYEYMFMYQNVDLEDAVMACQPDDQDLFCDLPMIHEEAVRRVFELLPREDRTAGLAELFKVFGDPTRVRILQALRHSELCVCDLSALLSMSQSAISHQLRILRGARLVRNRREGRVIYYSLMDDHVKTILDVGSEHLAEEVESER